MVHGEGEECTANIEVLLAIKRGMVMLQTRKDVMAGPRVRRNA